VDSEHWCEVVTRFGKLFKRAAGSAENLAAEARRRGVLGLGDTTDSLVTHLVDNLWKVLRGIQQFPICLTSLRRFGPFLVNFGRLPREPPRLDRYVPVLDCDYS
jgi:hypothetical protein